MEITNQEPHKYELLLKWAYITLRFNRKFLFKHNLYFSIKPNSQILEIFNVQYTIIF